MKTLLKQYLFTKSILVGDQRADNNLAALYTIADAFNIKITEGEELATENIIVFIANELGYYPPLPFYRGFPETVKDLSEMQLLFDQLVHYATTYSFGDFSHAGHSIFEGEYERLVFNENVPVREFKILKPQAALEKLLEYIEAMLSSTRPLNDMQYNVLLTYINEYNYKVEHCASKNTAMRLLYDTADIYYTRFLYLSDVIKFVDELNYRTYGERSVKRLNLKNRDRRFITAVIDEIFKSGRINIRDCYEKKALWCGLLHHIHYKPKCEAAENFVAKMRGRLNESVYSRFESAMRLRDPITAVSILTANKGTSAVLRNLDYILSVCTERMTIDHIVKTLDVNNATLLIQLILHYSNYHAEGERTFRFTRFNKLVVHYESKEEAEARRSILSPKVTEMLASALKKKLEALLKNRLGKVYISPEMYKVALPIQENTASGGYGTLPKGSRIPIDTDAKKIRAFTYWEKVNDIDLSVIGIDTKGEQTEFSWRSMFRKQCDEITYSGDQTSGYNGGSEYFDVDVAKFKKKYRNIRVLVFCNNVFSCTTFDACVCRAGYMLRDIKDTGEVFEPKTVKSSFTINCNSTFAYLFGIDLKTNEFVWLNVARESRSHVAGTTSLNFLLDYFNVIDVLNVGMLAEMLATEIVSTPEEADTVFSADETLELSEGKEQIHPYDTERINAIINEKK